MSDNVFERRNRATVAELLQEIKAAKTKSDRIKLLVSQKENQGFMSIIRLQFDDRFVFDLPSGVPEGMKLNTTPAGRGQVTLNSETRKLHKFLKSSPTKRYRKEGLFLGLLELLDKDEAEILLAVKDKKLGFSLTRKIIDEAFPGLIPATIKGLQDEKERTKDAGNSSGT